MKTFCEKLEDLIAKREAEIMKEDVSMVDYWLSWARGAAKSDMGWTTDTKKAVIEVLTVVKEDIRDAMKSRLED